MSSADDWIDDVFDVPTDGSNVDANEDDAQDNAYSEIGKSTKTETFAEKSTVLNKQIASDDQGADVFDYVEVDTQPVAKVSPTPPQQGTPRVVEKAVAAPSVVESPKTEEVSEPSETETDDEDNEPAVSETETVTSSSTENLSDDWFLTCTSAKLKTFYAHKAAKVQRLKKIGFIPFDKYQNELKNAHVSIWNPTDDTSVVNGKIKEIADWRNRVTQITLEVDPQLAWWSMVVEGLQGLLALAQYEKPKERQSGMHYLHLRDIEYYLSSLKGLKANCVSVMANLDKAYDSLSRQITVIMPHRDLERYAPSPSPSQSQTQTQTQKPAAVASRLSKVEEAPFEATVEKEDSATADFLSEFDRISDEPTSVKASSANAKQPIKKEASITKSWDDIVKKKR